MLRKEEALGRKDQRIAERQHLHLNDRRGAMTLFSNCASASAKMACRAALTFKLRIGRMKSGS